jgi:cytosine/adenosine deaminase-related metal-dependent hydrolase
LSDDSWKVIRDSGGRVSLSTPIEMAMGHGMPGIQGALDHGIRPSLSSDVDVTMGQDPFTVMRSTFTLQRLLALQRIQKNDPSPPKLLTCRDVLEFATIEGARCAGLDSKTGSITPGKEADLVLLQADRLNVWPLNNAAGCVVNLMGISNVESVFIAGKARKWRGALVGVDEARVKRIVADGRDGVLRRANVPLNLLG